MLRPNILEAKTRALKEKSQLQLCDGVSFLQLHFVVVHWDRKQDETCQFYQKKGGAFVILHPSQSAQQ